MQHDIDVLKSISVWKDPHRDVATLVDATNGGHTEIKESERALTYFSICPAVIRHGLQNNISASGIVSCSR